MIFLAASGPYDTLRISFRHSEHTNRNRGKQDILRNIRADAVIRLGALICNAEHRMNLFQWIQMFLQLLLLQVLAVDESLVVTTETQE